MSEKNPLQTMLSILKNLNNIHVTSVGFINTEEINKKRKEQDRKNSVFQLEGLVERGVTTAFSIANKDFAVSPDCWLVGKLEVGTHAKVKGSHRSSGDRIATAVVVTKPALAN
jgi:hypothetical protein